MFLWQLITTSPNLFGAVAAAVTAGIFAYVTMQRSKKIDMRQQAEAALLGIGPQIIKGLNDRLENQNKEIDNLWEKVLSATKLEEACRRDLASMTQEMRELRWQLQQAGIIPAPPRKPEDGN